MHWNTGPKPTAVTTTRDAAQLPADTCYGDDDVGTVKEVAPQPALAELELTPLVTRCHICGSSVCDECSHGGMTFGHDGPEKSIYNCKPWKKHGWCHRGEKCRFRHEEEFRGPKPDNGKEKRCSNCGKRGHKKKDCYSYGGGKYEEKRSLSRSSSWWPTQYDEADHRNSSNYSRSNGSARVNPPVFEENPRVGKARPGRCGARSLVYQPKLYT